VKGKVILLSALVLLMLFAFAPLMASSAKACIVVPATVMATGPPTMTITSVTPTPTGWIAKGDLVIPNLGVIGTGVHSKTYVTNSISTFTAVFDSKTDVVHDYFDGIWQVVGSPTDGFRYYPWSFMITEFNYNPTTMSYSYAIVQAVAFGFGIFAGETMVLHYAGTNTFEPWSGFVIIP